MASLATVQTEIVVTTALSLLGGEGLTRGTSTINLHSVRLNGLGSGDRLSRDVDRSWTREKARRAVVSFQVSFVDTCVYLDGKSNESNEVFGTICS